MLIFNNVKNRKNKNVNVDIDEIKNGDKVIINDVSGEIYKAIYDADSFVYKVFDRNNQLLFVTPDRDSLGMYVENPDLVESVNEY